MLKNVKLLLYLSAYKELIINLYIMLEYCKTILSKVSFSKSLFEKELRKAIKALIGDELRELQRWCYVKFGHIYEAILNRCFQAPSAALA